MDNSKQYRQCELHKTEGDSVSRHVAFIPSSKAKVGKVLRLPEPWGDGWVVDSVGPIRVWDDVDKIRENLKRFGWSLGK